MANNAMEFPKKSELEEITKKLEKISDLMGDSNEQIKKLMIQIKNLDLKNLNIQIKNISDSIKLASNQLKPSSGSNIFSVISDGAMNVMNSFKDFGSTLNTLKNAEKPLTNLKKEFKGILTVTKSLGRVVSGKIGLDLLAKGLDGVTDAAYKMKVGIGDSEVAMQQYSTSITTMIAGGALLGQSLLPGFGAVLGAFGGALASYFGTLKGQYEGLRELAKEDLFGPINVSVSQWKELFDNSSLSISDAGQRYDELRSKLSSLSDAFTASSDSLDLYGIRFGLITEKITSQDITGMTDAVNTMCTSTTQMIDENTNHSLLLWSNMLTSLEDVSSETQQSILNGIITNSNEKRLEVEMIGNEMMAIIENVKAKGEFTAEDYGKMQEQMNSLNEITVGQMSEGQARVELMKTQFQDKMLALDEESYSNYKTALTQFEEEKKKIAEDNYMAALISAEQFRGKDDEENTIYLEAKKAAYDNYIKEINTIDKYTKESNNEVATQLRETWDKIKSDTSFDAVEQRRVIKEMYKDLGLDTSELKTEVSKAGKDVGEEFSSSMSDNLYINGTSLCTSWNHEINKLGRAVDNGGLVLSNPFLSMMVSSFASGGFVPNLGQLFIANEPGNPELIGNVGGRTAVVNNQMILDGIHSAMRSAIIEGMQLVYNRDQRGDMFVDVYVDGVFTERKLMQTNQKHLLKTGRPVFMKG